MSDSDSFAFDGLRLGPHPQTVVALWLGLLLAGQVGLLLLLLTIIFSTTLPPRLPVLLNFILISFLGTPVQLILFYTGQILNPVVPYEICLTQTVLKHAVDAAFFPALLLFTIECYRSAAHGPKPYQISTMRNSVLLSLPYLHAIPWGLAVLIVGIRYPNKVSRELHGHFCSLADNSMGLASTIETAIFVFLMIVWQGRLWMLWWRRRKAAKTFGFVHQLNLALILRIAMFTTWELISLLYSSRSATGNTPIASSFLATLPLTIFLIFATQRNILRLWFRCIMGRPTEVPTMPPTSQRSQIREISIQPLEPVEFMESRRHVNGMTGSMKDESA
ncbi:hypothetical protein SISSUDRAFT_665571 [Sistotremastrum suecicum HHB10207 ss-3]|uniref:G-protein coupled receptors family 1 profile domain-containing protein n=1 Tax=Sistotremastrum suecicum HHB10207 ss-3 TaxID=1314776 RepID=A0A166E356_9AGAM|nr:hypothetical protein SISSUDRAFT_665571 [Sistotremastrum suecicum HHB10207 ss-3]